MIFLFLFIIGAGCLLSVKTTDQNKSLLIYLSLIAVAGMLMFNNSDSILFDVTKFVKEGAKTRKQVENRNRRKLNTENLREALKPEAREFFDRLVLENPGYETVLEEMPRERKEFLANKPADVQKQYIQDRVNERQAHENKARRDTIIRNVTNHTATPEEQSMARVWIDDTKETVKQLVSHGQPFTAHNELERLAVEELSGEYLVARSSTGEWGIWPHKLEGRSPQDVAKEHGINLPETAEFVEPKAAPVEPAENKTENRTFNPAESAPEIKTPERAPAEPKPEIKGEVDPWNVSAEMSETTKHLFLSRIDHLPSDPEARIKELNKLKGELLSSFTAEKATINTEDYGAVNAALTQKAHEVGGKIANRGNTFYEIPKEGPQNAVTTPSTPPADLNSQGDASLGSPFSVYAFINNLRERAGIPKVEDVRRHIGLRDDMRSMFAQKPSTRTGSPELTQPVLPGSAQGSLDIGVPEWWRRLVAAANPAQNPTPTVDLLRELRSTTSLTRYNEILSELDARGVNPEGRFFPKRWSYADVEEAKAERKKHLKIDRELQTSSEPDYKPLFGIDVVAPLRKALAKRDMRKNIAVDDTGKMQVTLTQKQAEDVFNLPPGTELTNKTGMQVSHNGDTYTITFDRGITQKPLDADYADIINAGGKSFVENLSRRYQELEKERNVAEILGDTDRVKALESAMEQILPSKVDSSGNPLPTPPIPENISAFRGVSPLLNLGGRPLENFNNSFGREINEAQFNDILRLFTPEELAARGIRLRRTLPPVSTNAGPVTSMTAPGTKFIIEPLRIGPDGTPVFDPAAPSFANNPRMKRDAEGNLFVDARDINNREGFFEGGEDAVLENRETDGFYRVNNPQAKIGAGVETPKAKGGPGVSSSSGTDNQGINVTVRNGRGIGCLLPASIAIGAGGLGTAGLMHHTAKPYDEKKEEYVKTNAQPSEEVVTEAAGMMLDELGLPHTDEYMDTARARVIQNYEQTWAEYYDDNHIFDKPFGYMASGVENGVPELASDAYDSTMRGLGLRRRDEPKQKLNYERKDYVSAVLNKRRSVKKEEKKAPKPEPSKDVPEPWSLDKALQNARNWEMTNLRLPKAVEPVSHTLTGAGIGAAAGGTVGALRYLFGSTAQLSAEEKKRRKLLKMIMSNAGIGAGIGATVGSIADVRHGFIEPPEIKS